MEIQKNKRLFNESSKDNNKRLELISKYLSPYEALEQI